MSTPIYRPEPGDRATLWVDDASSGLAAGTVVWVRRVGDGVAEVVTDAAEPRRGQVAISALRPFVEGDARASRWRLTLWAQVLTPICAAAAVVLAFRMMNGWPRYEEPRALPTPPSKMPPLPRERPATPAPLPPGGR